MAGQTYQVNYIVNVDAVSAQNAINSFKRAVASMDKATKPLIDLQNKVRGLVETMSALNRGKYSVNINTKPATQKIGKLIRALQMAKSEVQQLNAMGVTLGATKGRAATKAIPAPIGGSRASQPRVSPARTTPATSTSARAYTPMAYTRPGNLSYKLFGPTPLPNNGGMAIDMLKGMGIAYGIAGMGSLISNIVQQSADYDNTMKTVENILKAHNKKDNFNDRYVSMTQTVRNVGMKTKFKVTEVADAARFLAMAGLDVDAIQKAISPIADIALVGDTELGQTADLVTNIMTAYNIAPDKMRNAADIMTNTFTMSNTTLTEIAESYKYAASLLSAGDVSFEEATAAIGVLGDAGIKGSQAGTTMRTIMANIANPTKKQRAAWEQIGISLLDESGNRKNLLEIFQELHDANLDVDTFYKIFHKTAASGAVALAAHADKWENIYMENFLAGGMTRRLAEEKQNTLQGLWAQLTSVFTDQGVTAFSGVEGTLRGWMKTAIDWLNPRKNPDAQRVFREIADAITEFMKVLIQASKWFAWFFDNFGPFIKVWAKFQLMIWPVVKAITAFKSVFLGLMSLRKVGMTILGLANAFTRLGNAASVASAQPILMGGTVAGTASTGNKAMMAPMTPFGFRAGTAMLPGLTHQQYMKAAEGLALARPHAVLGVSESVAKQENQRLIAQYRKDRKIFNKRVRNAQFMNGAKGVGAMGAGMAAVGAGMLHMTKDDANTADVVAGGLLNAAGIGAMAGGPIGLALGAVLAAASTIPMVIGATQHIDKVIGALNTFTQSHQLLDGVLLNGDSRIEKYLELVWRKNADINDLIRRRTELMKEYLGLEGADATTKKDIGNSEFKHWLDKFHERDDNELGSRGAAQDAATMFNSYARQFGMSIELVDGDWTFKDKSGHTITYNNPEGTSDTNDAVMADVAAAMELLHGPYRKKIMDENQHRLAAFLYGKSTAQDVRNWQKSFAEAYGPTSWGDKIRPNQWNQEIDVANFWSGEDVNKSYVGSRLLWETMSKMRQGQEYIAKFKEKAEAGKLTEADVIDALRWGDYDILGQTLTDYHPNDVVGWFRHLGYQNNGVWRDPSRVETPEIMAQTAIGHMQKLLAAIDKLGPNASEATQDLQSNAKILIALAQAYLDAGDKVQEGRYEGEEMIAQGQKWRWNSVTKLWELIGDDNKPVLIANGLRQMSTNLENLLQTVDNVNQNWPSAWPGNNFFGGNTGRPTYLSDFSDWLSTPNTSSWNDNTAALAAQLNSIPQNKFEDAFWNDVKGSTTKFDAQNYLDIGSKTPTGWSKTTLTPSAMYARLHPQKHSFGKANPLTDDNVNDSNPNNSNQNHGLSSSDYKSHYKERAIPKQININIQNLMNVDSIDMTSPEKAAVIDRVKREIAYALVEAASDGTMMLNGLTN